MLLNVKYRLMEAELKYPLSYALAWRKLRFQSSRMTVHRVELLLKASKFLKEHTWSGRPQVISNTSSKRLRQWLHGNDKTGRKEENHSLFCIQDGQKEEKKKSETFQETTVESRNGSEAPEEEPLYAEWHEKSRESNSHIFPWESFHRWPCLQQTEWCGRNDWKWYLWTLQSVNNQASVLNQYSWRRSIERGEGAFGLVSTMLQQC